MTGASRGLGYAAAIALAKAGSDIIAVARTQGGLEDLDDAVSATGQKATLVPMDITDGEAVDRLGGVIAERWGRLDGLLANAGVLGDMSPVSHITPKSWDNVIAVNLTANYRLIRSFDMLLRASGAGRAVFVTSGAAVSRKAYWGGYAASKAGLDALVQSWAKEVAQLNLRVNLLNPGATATAMRAKAMPGENPSTLPQPTDLAPMFVKMLSPAFTKNGEILNYREDYVSGS